MNLFRLGTALAVIGVVMVGGSVAWWQRFYAEVAAVLGAQADPPLQCLYSTAGPCGQVIELAAMIGANPYRPGYLWIGAGLLLLGGILEIGARPRSQSGMRSSAVSDGLATPGPKAMTSEEWGRFKAAAFPKDER